MKDEIDFSDPDERPPRKRRYIQCADRMCGALDCPRCRPENFVAGVYFGDIDNQTDEEQHEH